MKTVADTRIAFKHAETDRIHTRGFAHPAMGVDLPALHADLHREFAHGPRDQTLILFDFKKPAISGYRGEVACDTLPKWEAALKEWGAGALDRHRLHLKETVSWVEGALSETVSKVDHAADRAERDKAVVDGLETIRSLCTEQYAVKCMLTDTCAVPETTTDMALGARDNILEVLLCTLWTFLREGGANCAKRFVNAGLARLLVKRLKLFIQAHSEHSATEVAKILVPRFIGCLTELAQVPESRSHFSSKGTAKTLLGMMSFCHSRGLSEQITPLVALLAPVVNPSTIPTDTTPDNMHVIFTLASNSPRLSTRCSALHVYLACFNAKKSHTQEEVDENLRLLVTEIKWALDNLDLPAKALRYLSSNQQGKERVLSQNPDLLEQMATLKKQEPELFVMLHDAAELQLKHRSMQAASSGGNGSHGGGGTKKPHTSTLVGSRGGRPHHKKRFVPTNTNTMTYGKAIEERRDRLDELLLVCVFGLWARLSF